MILAETYKGRSFDWLFRPVMTGLLGATYLTVDEHRALLSSAGFSDVQVSVERAKGGSAPSGASQLPCPEVASRAKEPLTERHSSGGRTPVFASRVRTTAALRARIAASGDVPLAMSCSIAARRLANSASGAARASSGLERRHRDVRRDAPSNEVGEHDERHHQPIRFRRTAPSCATWASCDGVTPACSALAAATNSALGDFGPSVVRAIPARPRGAVRRDDSRAVGALERALGRLGEERIGRQATRARRVDESVDDDLYVRRQPRCDRPESCRAAPACARDASRHRDRQRHEAHPIRTRRQRIRASIAPPPRHHDHRSWNTEIIFHRSRRRDIGAKRAVDREREDVPSRLETNVDHPYVARPASHRHRPRIPTVEVAHQRHPFRARRRDGESHAGPRRRLPRAARRRPRRTPPRRCRLGSRLASGCAALAAASTPATATRRAMLVARAPVAAAASPRVRRSGPTVRRPGSSIHGRSSTFAPSSSKTLSRSDARFTLILSAETPAPVASAISS